MSGRSELQRTSFMIPLAHKRTLQRFADERYMTLSNAIREALGEKVEKIQRDRVESEPKRGR